MLWEGLFLGPVMRRVGKLGFESKYTDGDQSANSLLYL